MALQYHAIWVDLVHLPHYLIKLVEKRKLISLVFIYLVQGPQYAQAAF